MKTLQTLFIICTLLIGASSFSQNARKDSQPILEIQGEVLDDETGQPISKVNIEVLGGAYTTTDNSGRFTIKGSIGQELIIRSSNFETVYHTISTNDFIRIKVINTAMPQRVSTTLQRQ